MTSQQIRFDDGAAYERMMGGWSRLAGETFLQWLKPLSGRRWIDVGCGNGAFTELVLDKCAPDSVFGVDPSEGQLDYARKRLTGRPATFHRGDAMSLPVPDRSVEVAVMALVIFFVPEPGKGVAEMVRVVQPGGLVGAYAWDVLRGGFTQEPIQAEMRAIGLVPTLPPRADASQTSALETLWKDAGLSEVEVRQIDIARTFESFDDYWSSSLAGMTGQKIGTLPVAQQEELKERVRKRFPVDDAGRIVCTARANAVKGRVRA